MYIWNLYCKFSLTLAKIFQTIARKREDIQTEKMGGGSTPARLVPFLYQVIVLKRGYILTTKSWYLKIFGHLCTPPPPFTDKIRKVVFDGPPKSLVSGIILLLILISGVDIEHLAHPKANSSFGATVPQLSVTFLQLMVTMKERVTVTKDLNPQNNNRQYPL